MFKSILRTFCTTGH